jgi:hypothetical protein
MEATEHGSRIPKVLDGKAVPLPQWVSVRYPWYFRFSDLHGRGFSGYGLLRLDTLCANTDMSVDYDLCSLYTYSLYIYIYTHTHTYIYIYIQR